MSDTKTVKILKVGMLVPPADVKQAPATTRKSKAKSKSKPDHQKKPKFGILKGGRTLRNKPRFEAVRDPASAPPTRKSLRILTHKGEKTRREKIAEAAKKKTTHEKRKILADAGLPVSAKRKEIIDEVYEHAQEAGMLSV
jgi:hypothetical protein